MGLACHNYVNVPVHNNRPVHCITAGKSHVAACGFELLSERINNYIYDKVQYLYSRSPGVIIGIY